MGTYTLFIYRRTQLVTKWGRALVADWDWMGGGVRAEDELIYTIRVGILQFVRQFRRFGAADRDTWGRA